MPDREKVIKGLECCISEHTCRGCPYREKGECEDSGYYYSKAIEDALALLKEQPEIIRCKDCKHYDHDTQSCNDGLDGIFLPDWFCADGERR